MSQFAKFSVSPWQSCPNSAADLGLPFVRKLSFILFKKLQYLDDAPYKGNCHSYFF